MADNNELPQYFRDVDYRDQETYQERLNQQLFDWFNSDGFSQPVLTNAQVAVIVALNKAEYLGKHWYNSDLDKMQFLGAGNTTQVITSV